MSQNSPSGMSDATLTPHDYKFSQVLRLMAYDPANGMDLWEHLSAVAKTYSPSRHENADLNTFIISYHDGWRPRPLFEPEQILETPMQLPDDGVLFLLCALRTCLVSWKMIESDHQNDFSPISESTLIQTTSSRAMCEVYFSQYEVTKAITEKKNELRQFKEDSLWVEELLYAPGGASDDVLVFIRTVLDDIDMCFDA